jgi:dihydropteroate synthase
VIDQLIGSGVRVYFRPVGLLSGETARMAVENSLAVPLGGGPLAFTAVETLIRAGGGQIGRGFVRVTSLDGEASGALLDRLALPRRLELPSVMGVVNVTPDSFSDAGAFLDSGAAVSHGTALLEAGAGILDIGGESTRPGAQPVPPDEEMRRVLPVIEALAPLARDKGAFLSIDTRNPATMRAALAAGAGMLNDVTALTDPDCLEVAADSDAPVVLMHMQGTPQTMQAEPRYEDAPLDIFDWLEARIQACEAAGIMRDRLIADPGIGFGKTVRHNLEILARISLFHGLGVPVLVGASRKGFIGRLSRGAPVDERLGGSIAAVLEAFQKGVQTLRVHDVAATVQALTIAAAVRDAG